MLKTLKKFFAFCGVDNRRLFMASIWLGVVSAICSAMRIPAAAIVIQALLQKNVTMATLWTSLGIIVASLIVTIAINMKATMLQTRAGYRACANKRIEIAEHLRYLPMGWFNDNSLGEVTSVTTNTMENMANIATRVVMVTTRGFLTSGIIAVMMFLFDWRMGLITLAGLLLFFAVNAAMQRAEQALSQRKFNADERLVSKVLEYVQGIAEVKNFDLTHDSATQVHGAVEDARKASFAMEIPSVLYMLAQFIVNKLTGVAVCAAAIVFYFGGTMELTNCLLMLICSFILFEQLDSAGSFSALFRSIDIGVDKANAILNVEPMDIDGEELSPEREDITLSHVDFSYDSKPIAQHVAPTGNLQTAVPRANLLGSVRNRKICAHVLNLRTFEPRLCNHLYRRPIGCVKHQHTAGKRVYHGLHQRLDLLRQKIIEHPGGKEHRAAGGINLRKPCRVVQVAGDIFLPLPGG